jgi:hypothetical protein
MGIGIVLMSTRKTFRFDADPDTDPEPVPTLRFTHVGKSENLFCLFMFPSEPVYIVLPFFSASQVSKLSIFRTVYWKAFWKKSILQLNFFGLNRYGSGSAGPWMPIRVRILRNDADPDTKHCLKCRTISLSDKTVQCRLWTVLYLFLRKSASQFSDVTRRCWSMLSGHWYYAIKFTVPQRVHFAVSLPVYRISHLVPSTRYLVTFCTKWHLSFHLFSHFTSTE